MDEGSLCCEAQNPPGSFNPGQCLQTPMSGRREEGEGRD